MCKICRRNILAILLKGYLASCNRHGLFMFQSACFCLHTNPLHCTFGVLGCSYDSSHKPGISGRRHSCHPCTAPAPLSCILVSLIKVSYRNGGHGWVTTDGWVLKSQNNCVSYLSVSLSGFDAQICIQSVISICRPL